MRPIDAAQDAAHQATTELARQGLSAATSGIRVAEGLVRRLGDGDVDALREAPEGEPFEVERPDGAVIRGDVAGPSDGVTVVLTHGYGLTRASWNLVAAELVERGDRVVRFDWRAHGASDIGDVEVRTQVLVDDLQAVLYHLDVQDALLVAHSTGGYVALAALVEQPTIADRLQGLVLAATLAGELLGDPQTEDLHLLRNSVLDRLVRNETLRMLLAGFTQGLEISTAVSKELLDEFTEADHGALVTLLEDLAGRSYYGQLDVIDLPAVVICGAADMTTPPSHGEAIANELAEGRVVTVEDASHLLNWQHPDRIIDLAAELLERQGADTSGDREASNPALDEDGKDTSAGDRSRAVVLLNPAAGQHDADDTEAMIGDTLEAAGFDVVLRRTEGEGDARNWAGEAAEDGADLVVVAGGDGTVREALEGVAGSEGDCPVGVIPLGTANLLARSLDIPTDDVDAAAELAAGDATRRLDLFDLVDRDHHAMLMVDAGFDAELVRDSSRRLKNALGAFAYVAAGLKNTLGRDTVDLALEVDGELHPASGHSVLGLNVGRIGDAFVVDEDIQPDDGRLHVGIVSSPSPVGVLTTAAGMGLLGRDAQPNVEWIACEHLKLVAEPPLPVQVDGDPAGETPIEIRVVPQAVAVVVPGDR